MMLSRQFLLMMAAAVLLGFGARVVQKNPVPFWGFPKPIKLVQPKAALAESNMATPDSAFAPSDQAYLVDQATTMILFMKRAKYNVHFIDAREPKLYNAGHIPGSKNIPFEKVGEHIDEIGAMPIGDLYLLYCDGGDCHLSKDLAEYMQGRGFKRLAVYEGGWADWSKEAPDFVEKKE
jgi:rhodanese-related sulfurtransferase